MNKEDKPFALKQCEACGGTMWMQSDWIQCIECGATSTHYGGCYLNLSRTVEKLGPVTEFKAA